ncbi:MAG: AAA family ATPase [Parabacteroides gordonii]|jgi:predicted ATPase|uniref:AAA family ATPase n=1 Tax=Parabacteroides gordonii TaxID=574930 RepID=UPI00241D68D8|nr:AAA family ATPase [Parabacteroides gordonii]
MLKQTGLYVITGGPGTGKTSLIEELERSGFKAVEEVAREIIKEQMQQGGEALPWKDTALYTELMLERSIDSYLANAGNDGILFFDRGIPDTLAYAALIGLPDKENIEQAVAKYRYSKQVFILPPWEDIYCTDKERKQLFNEAIDTYYVMKEVYEKAGYTLIEIPKIPVTERRDFVIDSIRLF